MDKRVDQTFSSSAELKSYITNRLQLESYSVGSFQKEPVFYDLEGKNVLKYWGSPIKERACLRNNQLIMFINPVEYNGGFFKGV